MTVPWVVSTPVLWTVHHGISRMLTPRAARRGDPVARYVVEPQVRADPYPVLEQLRRHGPVTGTARFSVTTDHAAAAQILRSAQFGVAGVPEGLPGPLSRWVRAADDPYALGPLDPPSLLGVDPPEHTRLRRMVARAFTARRVAGLEEHVTTITHRLLDELAAEPSHRVDLIERFAARLPVAVIADLLGVPEQERGPLLEWGNAAAAQLDGQLSLSDYRRSRHALKAMHRWFQGHLVRLREQALAGRPGTDVLSSILVETADLPPVERPSQVELRSVGLLVLGAGFETTVNLIGNAVAQLDRHPDQRDWLIAHPQGWAHAVEEVLRFDSPVQVNARRALVDTEVAGFAMPAGHVALILIGMVNRDPRVFADPNRFDVRRADAEAHLAFSTGAHFCLGSGLARLEARVALRELFDRFPELRIDGTPVRRDAVTLRGYDHLPVRLR